MGTMSNPFAHWLDTGEAVLLDGGLGTELERRGHAPLGKLWSAALVRTNPAAIRAVHRDYMDAGAKIITTATFQAAVPTLRHVGFHRAEAEDFLRDAVALATRERDRFVHRHAGYYRPLVAASVGPYGASLCNGAEYTGAYDISDKQLISYHVERLRVLAETDADVIALETIPSMPEARVLLQLMQGLPQRWAWLSLMCRDAYHLADGTALSEVLKLAQDVPNLCAIGINCMAPRIAAHAIDTLQHFATVPIIVYPNASNLWNPAEGQSKDEAEPDVFAEQARDWLDAGAQIIGGCCQTTPAHIRALNAVVCSRPRKVMEEMEPEVELEPEQARGPTLEMAGAT